MDGKGAEGGESDEQGGAVPGCVGAVHDRCRRIEFRGVQEVENLGYFSFARRGGGGGGAGVRGCGRVLLCQKALCGGDGVDGSVTHRHAKLYHDSVRGECIKFILCRVTCNASVDPGGCGEVDGINSRVRFIPKE